MTDFPAAGTAEWAALADGVRREVVIEHEPLRILFEEAVDLLLKEFPNLVRADEIAAAQVMLAHIFTPATAAGGWGTMDPAVWQNQIALYNELEQFSAGAPALDAVIDMRALEATADARPKIG